MKLLATDYDGTLKYLDHVTQRDVDAIHKWKEAGNIFVIDTGRSMESILIETNKYKLPVDYFITNNGGMAFDHKQNELFSSYMDNTISVDMIYIAKTIDGVVSYVVNDGFHRHRIVVNDTYEEKRYPNLNPDMSEEELMNLNKYSQIVISFKDTEIPLKVADKINYYFSDYIVAYANKYVVDIVLKGMSKATGIELIRKQLKIDIDDVYIIGDADNDISMIEYGNHGCCMSLASDEVKKHAKKAYDCIADMIEDIL